MSHCYKLGPLIGNFILVGAEKNVSYATGSSLMDVLVINFGDLRLTSKPVNAILTKLENRVSQNHKRHTDNNFGSNSPTHTILALSIKVGSTGFTYYFDHAAEIS
jgi:hypothetical protein